jgi:hypothetical protein
MMQIELIQIGVLTPPGTFILQDDPDLPGLLKGQFTVKVTDFCTTEPDQPSQGSQFEEDEGFAAKFFHLRSEAERNVGDLAGLTRAAVEVDVVAEPFPIEEFEGILECY